MRIRVRVMTIAGFAALSGCAASQCDPNRADLFTGIGCSVGPGYADREHALTTQRDASLQQSALNQGQAVQASQDAAAAQNQYELTQARVRTLDVNLNKLQRKLRSAQQSGSESAASLQRANTEMQQLQAQRAALAPDPAPQQLQAVEDRARALSMLLNGS